MPVFQPKIRTIDSYLAGIGASTALLASALVMFLILVSVATFDSWPHGGLFGGAGTIKLNAEEAGLPAPPQPSAPNLARLLGGGGPAAASRPAGNRGGQPRNGGLGSRKGGPQAQFPGPTQTSPPPQPSPGPSPTTSPRNVVQQTASGVGNAVESDTTALGNDLSHTSPTAGGLVSGAGRTLNDTLQTVADQLGPN